MSISERPRVRIWVHSALPITPERAHGCRCLFDFPLKHHQSKPSMSLPSETLSRIIHPPTLHQPVLSACQIRTTVNDFQVEEIPAYQPTGAGEHAYLWIEKRGVASPELVNRIIKTLGVPSKDVGLAGQKDRYAVTRQFCSIPKRLAINTEKLNSDDVKVLSVTPHNNKLKTGHLKGNRFQITLRNPESPYTAADVEKVQTRLNELVASGIPNYFGPQRFGHGGNTVVDGLRLLKGKLPKDHWPESRSRTLRRLALSSVQSAVFNLVASSRVTAGTASTPQPGDVVIRKNGTKPYLYPEGADTENIVPAGPMPGPEMPAAKGAVAEIEAAALLTMGLQPRDFERFAKLTSGVRRKMVEFPSEVSAILNDDSSMTLGFVLSAGTYATTLLQEIAAQVIDLGPDAAPVYSEPEDEPSTGE